MCECDLAHCISFASVCTSFFFSIYLMFISLNFWEQALQCVCVCFLIFLSLFCSLILFISSNILFMLLPIFSILLQVSHFTLCPSVCFSCVIKWLIQARRLRWYWFLFTSVMSSVDFNCSFALRNSLSLSICSRFLFLLFLYVYVCFLDWVGLR